MKNLVARTLASSCLSSECSGSEGSDTGGSDSEGLGWGEVNFLLGHGGAPGIAAEGADVSTGLAPLVTVMMRWWWHGPWRGADNSRVG